MAKTNYRGFNTIDQSKKFRIADIDLVKRDLLNHFQIRKGEKLMNPDFGSIIWNMIYEPLTDETKKVIIDDVTKIVSYDPRLQVDQVIIQQLEYGLQLQIGLTYLPSASTTRMNLTFNGQSNSVTAS